MKSPLFFAKIILFGEYGIIEDSKGLIVPYNFYQGSLKFDDCSDVAKKSNQSLKKLAEYCQVHLTDVLDITALNKDISEGMSFDSNIPQGYGVGSSGALVAAIYDRYAVHKINPNADINKSSIEALKNVFSLIESFFHGKSSGLDPLICYLNIPLLIESKTEIATVGIPEQKAGNGAIFLINSGSPGETAPMVQIFFEKLKHEGFRKTLKDEFIKYNNACIESFVKGDLKNMFGELKQLSSWALTHFKPMIPEKLWQLWQYGIDSNAYYLKLCGSGGGGYVLGFTENYQEAKKHLKDFPTEIIYSF